MPSEAFRDLPELFETVFEESIAARTDAMATFKQLGPPDLVHAVKTLPSSRHQVKEVSCYHLVNGVDTSSSAAIAAYINSLTYSMERPNRWFGSTALKNAWSLSRSTYCCYNAFSAVDVRVEARIPGGVKSFVVDHIGGRQATNGDMWQEAFLSSILRAIFQADCKQPGLRTLNGLLNLQMEMRFLEAAGRLFVRGWQLGSPDGPFLAASHNNYLTRGVVQYFCAAGRPEVALGFLKPFADKDRSLRGLITQCLLAADQQGAAVQLMTETLRDDPFCSMMLLAVADFLLDRGEWSRAEQFAAEAVRTAPNDFNCWARLIRLQILQQRPEQALLLLNNAPMTAYPETDHRKTMPTPAAISIPQTKGTRISSSDNTQPGSPALAVLERLRAGSLRGTFREAYGLLVALHNAVGWETLLRHRSAVFVMEEDYRRVQERVRGGLGGAQEGHEKDVDMDTDTDTSTNSTVGPTQPEPVVPLDSHVLSHTGKKLCERWLDSLFLTLFEDVRVISLYQTELAQQTSSKPPTLLPIVRSSREWLLLGQLSLRLDKLEEAKFALHRCVFTPGGKDEWSEVALERLVQVHSQEGRTALALTAAARLIALRHRYFDHAIHPSVISTGLLSLVRQHGLSRLRADLGQLEGGNLAPLHELLSFAHDAKVHGFDY